MDLLSELLDAAAPADQGGQWPGGGLLILLLPLLVIPLGPAEPAAVATGALVSAGALPLWAGVPVVAAGMFAGNLLAFHAGGPVLRLLRRRPQDAARLERWQTVMGARPLRRDAAVVLVRLVPGARTPAVLAARSAGVGTARFCLLDAVGSLLWAGLWVGAGSVVQQVPSAAGAAVLLIGGAAVVVLLVRRGRGGSGAAFANSARDVPAG